MELPQILQPGSVMNDLPSSRTGAFSRTVVDDGNLGMEIPNQRLGIGKIRPVMRHQKKIHFAQQIVRAGQFKLFLLRQITQIQKTEPSICNQDADRSRVFGVVDRG